MGVVVATAVVVVVVVVVVAIVITVSVVVVFLFLIRASSEIFYFLFHLALLMGSCPFCSGLACLTAKVLLCATCTALNSVPCSLHPTGRANCCTARY